MSKPAPTEVDFRVRRRDDAFAKADALYALADRGGTAFDYPEALRRRADRWAEYAEWVDRKITDYPRGGGAL